MCLLWVRNRWTVPRHALNLLHFTLDAIFPLDITDIILCSSLPTKNAKNKKCKVLA